MNKNPTAEIIATGSELLTPDRTDTNSLFLTERLNSIGIEVRQKTIVGDDDARMEEAVADALRRSEIVITTGGLGPTEDDVTRKSVARALRLRLVLHDDLLEGIRSKFRRMNREMPEINARQAMILETATVLPNARGTAPGMYVERDGRHVICLPGPPREMNPMFDEDVLPRLAAATGRTGGTRVVRRTLRVAGMGESAIDERISPIYKQHQNPQTTILFNKSEVEIRLTARADTEAEAELLLDGLANQIEERLGEAVFAFRGETMEEVVGLRLETKGFTVACAESCTGGLISERLTEVPGSSIYFMEGVVTYSNDAKIRSLGVDAELIATHGAVSSQVAEAMAEGVRRRAGTDFGVSVTGVAGPGGGTEEKPVGLVYIALAEEGHVEHRRVMLPGDRTLIRWRASQAALDLLRRRLL